MKKKKLALVHSVIALLLCVSMLMGTTFAWFTDGVTSGKNRIVAGNLDVELEYLLKTANGYNWEPVKENTNVFAENTYWEPGHTEVVYLRVSNLGSLALKYQLGVNIAAEAGSVNMAGQPFVLSDYIEFDAIEGVETAFADRDAARAEVKAPKILSTGYVKEATMEAGDAPHYVAFVVYMPETVDNAANYRTGELPPRIELGINLFATQFTSESDSFGSDYDFAAGFPEVDLPDGGKADVTVTNGTTAGAVTISGNAVSADVPEGVAVNDGTTALTLTVTELSTTGSNITASQQEVLKPVDVHVEGVSANNTKPITVTLAKFAAIGLNEGSLKLYHVENGKTNAMTRVASVADFTAHNQFAYDPATGDVTLYLATFSEVAMVANTVNAWEGNFDYSWYDANANTLTIANADQLAAFGAIVGGMNGQTQASFSGKTVKLISDINLGDKESENNPDLIFYPIGYYNNTNRYEKSSGGSVTSNVSSFEGTFDGNGHTVKNFYQNTWEMFGDYNNGYSGTPNHYKDAMGLFGYVNGGTVKNLTVDSFSSDGEFTPTGVIAAYVDGDAVFENIAITNCNPRVYNTGNGGIIGIAGDTGAANDDHIKLKNITVDNSNKISALWGSYDVACGGLVGMYRGNVDGSGNATGDTIGFENCHVSAVIDVYNDVCGNYQYYAYRYAGMIIGSVRHNTKNDDGKTIPDMTGISATGCTVNYGDWNDYYYCEFVKNGHPSYSGPDDYKFSRVPNSEIDTTNGKENATCIGHNHTDVEENQAIYLPFHQLFTGYSWGVSSIGLKEYSGIVTDLDITEGDQEESVEKFESKFTGDTVITEKTVIKVGDLFSDVNGAEINNSAVQVAVSALDANGITADYVADTSDWKNSTLTFNSVAGLCSVSIQDYNFCKPTTIILKNGSLHDVFASNFTGNFLYRVGNKNAVSLGTLFKENGVEIHDSHVKVTISGGQAVYTANAEDWTQGTLQFSNTGLVTITIQDDTYSNVTTLNLEVVAATNVTKYSELKNQPSVLLNDVTMSNNGALYISGGATLYGNGFTLDCTNGAYTGSGSVSENYVIELVDAHLDNVKVIGKVYTQYGAQASNDYNRALVVSKGNSSVTNCYLSNTASPIRLVEGSLNVKGTTVKGGNFANIDVRNGHLTLEDVITINQALSNDKAEDGTTVIGLGVVVFYENVDPALTSVTIKGTLSQHNHISSNDKFTHDYATQFVNQMMTGDYAEYRTEINGVKWVNTGIIALTDGVVPVDNRTDKAGYAGKAVSFVNKDGYVYTVKPTQESTDSNVPEYSTSGQGAIAPTYSFDYTTKNYVAKTDNSNDYCYYENGKVLIAMDQGDTFEWDPFILTATKNGKTLAYTVAMNGTTYASGQKITFNTSDDYVVTYTYTDEDNYTVSDTGELIATDVTYTKTVNISVSVIKPTTQHATFTFADTNTATVKVTVGDKTYISALGVSATDKEWGYITVNGTKIFYPITEAQMKTSSKLLGGKETQVYYYVFKDAVTITDYKDGGTGGEQKYDSSTTTMPTNLTVVNGMEAKYTAISSACVDISKLTKDGPSGEVWDFSASTTVSGTTMYGDYLAHSSPSGLAVKSGTRDYDAITVAQFSYTDAAGATYYYFVGYYMPNQVSSSSGSGSSPCVTPDTLITLADGTQKRIDQVTYADKLLVWDFFKGDYAVAPSAIIFDHGAGNNDVIRLTFSDGTVVKAVNLHQFFDATLNRFVTIDAETVEQFVGHSFARQGGTAKLVNYEVTKEYVEAWGIISATHYNIFVEGMLSTDFMVEDYGLFNYFEVGEGMRYAPDKLHVDIAEYGLYAYEDFADYLTYEQFVAFNVPYFKVSVGKGNYTYEGILNLIKQYLQN